MIVGIVLTGLIALIVWHLFFKNQGEHPIDKLPGPPRTPFLGNSWLLMTTPPEKMLDLLVECTEKYGTRYVFSMPNIKWLHLAAAEDIEVVLAHTRNIKKSLVYDFLRDWLGAGLLLATGGHWHQRRKILTPTFHFNILKNFATVMQEKTHDMVEFLRQKNGKEVDLMPMVSDFTLYTICETAMGTKLDKEQSAASLEYKSAILDIGLRLLRRAARFWLHNDLVYKMTPSGRENLRALDIAKAFADNVIIERKAKRMQNANQSSQEDTSDGIGTKKRLAMLDLLLEAEEKGQIDMEGIRDEVNTFMFEGHDTTAMAITFGLMLLADEEAMQERIYEECQNILAGEDRLFTVADLAEMKYLEAVIKETLRIYPSVPVIGREVVEDFTLPDGLLVKKGTTIDIHFFELHRDPKVFPEPLKFRPERFLEHENRHPYAYVPFSAGPRNCIGQRFAMQEMKIMLSEIIRNFKLVPKVKGARPRLFADLVLRPADPIEIKFIPRK